MPYKYPQRKHTPTASDLGGCDQPMDFLRPGGDGQEGPAGAERRRI